jgi:hypothetical protein
LMSSCLRLRRQRRNARTETPDVPRKSVQSASLSRFREGASRQAQLAGSHLASCTVSGRHWLEQARRSRTTPTVTAPKRLAAAAARAENARWPER